MAVADWKHRLYIVIYSVQKKKLAVLECGGFSRWRLNGGLLYFITYQTLGIFANCPHIFHNFSSSLIKPIEHGKPIVSVSYRQCVVRSYLAVGEPGFPPDGDAVVTWDVFSQEVVTVLSQTRDLGKSTSQTFLPNCVISLYGLYGKVH